MELQTKVPLSHLNFQIDYNAQILLLGSCFSDHIGALFSKHQFNTISNPFGIIFHPIPLASLIQRIVHKNYFTEDAFFFHQEQWISLYLILLKILQSLNSIFLIHLVLKLILKYFYNLLHKKYRL